MSSAFHKIKGNPDAGYKKEKMEMTTTENNSSRTLQQIKPGYKKTTVGIIPKDWQVKSFNKCFKHLRAYTFSRNQLSNDNEENVIHNIHYGDIHSSFPKNHLNVKKHLDLIPSIINPEIDTPELLEDGDLIMADASEDYEGVGQSIELINVEDKKIVSGTHTFPLRPIEKFAPTYAGYIFSNYNTHKALKRIATGISVYGISKSNIAKIQLPIPPLPEQKAIADCLTTWDKGIEKLTQLIASKKEQKKGLMQQLLTGKKRLEGFEEEWREVRLEQVAKIVMGVSPSSKNYNDEKQGKFLIQGNADIKNRVSSPRQYTSEITKECSVGDILMSVRAPVGEISKSIHNACIGRGICAIQNNEYSTSDFLYYYLVYNEVLWNRLKQGSTFESVNSSDIRNFILTIPLINEQNAIAEVLNTADKEIELLENKLETFKTQKKGLMQVLLTGTLRLCSGTNG